MRASSVLITGGACLLILCLAVFVIRNVAAFAFAYSGAAAGQVDTERLRQLVASNLVWTIGLSAVGALAVLLIVVGAVTRSKRKIAGAENVALN